MSTSPVTLSDARPSPELRLLPWVAIVVIAAGLTFGLTADSPFNWMTLALITVGVFALLLWLSPAVLVGFLPLLMLPPEFAKVFAHEIGLVVIAGGLIAWGVRARAAWIARLDPIEATLAVLLLWGVISGFWAESSWWWLFGVRKSGIGLLALWAGWRAARFVNPRHFRLGLTATVWALATYTLIRATTAGALTTMGWVDRKRSTDVGWGTSNYIAAILVLMLPTVLEVALRDRSRAVRVFAWLALPLAALVMTVAASRGGVLFVLLIILLAVFRGRANWNAIALALTVVAAGATVALGPAGPRFLSRFTDAQELGSIVVRFLYYREGWRRLVGAWPRGFGLGQSISTIDRLGDADPHNYWLVVGAELGLLGLVLWTAMLVLMWRRIRAVARDPETAPIGWTMQLTFVIAQLNCLFEPTFQGLHYHFLFFWIFGSYFGSFATSPPRSAPPSSSLSSRAGTNPLAT